MKKEILEVNGIKCSGCVETIEKHLSSIAGITEVHASQISKTVEVLHTSEVSRNSIENELKKIGYPANT